MNKQQMKKWKIQMSQNYPKGAGSTHKCEICPEMIYNNRRFCLYCQAAFDQGVREAINTLETKDFS